MTVRILEGDALKTLTTLAPGSVRCCVTSPPYWGLRDYGADGQLGLEATPAAYVAALVQVFREVRRVLSDDGTLWLNLGDSYSSGGRRTQTVDTSRHSRGPHARNATNDPASGKQKYLNGTAMRPPACDGLGAKQMLMMPARVAIALQDDGWILRSDIVWSKPNPMPESVDDRPTKSHEYIFLFSKSTDYYYDAKAIAEPVSENTHARVSQGVIERTRALSGNGDRAMAPAPGKLPGVNPKAYKTTDGRVKANPSFSSAIYMPVETRNARSVWTIATQGYSGAHFATFPEELPRRCILAGSAAGDTVLDPFGGSGTTGAVATGNGRSAVLCEVNPEYVALIRDRIGPLLCEPATAVA